MYSAGRSRLNSMNTSGQYGKLGNGGMNGSAATKDLGASAMWHILTTEPQREFSVAAGLVGYRVTVYLPTYPVRVRAAPNTGKQFRAVDKPLFPGYLFARMASGGDWKAVHRVSGITGYLNGPEGPKLISDAGIALVRQSEKAALAASKIEREKPFKPGDQVRIDEDGNPWTGLDGVVERLDKFDRAVILLMMPNMAWPVSIATASLREVG